MMMTYSPANQSITCGGTTHLNQRKLPGLAQIVDAAWQRDETGGARLNVKYLIANVQ